jgi:hypothetical protein
LIQSVPQPPVQKVYAAVADAKRLLPRICLPYLKKMYLVCRMRRATSSGKGNNLRKWCHGYGKKCQHRCRPLITQLFVHCTPPAVSNEARACIHFDFDIPNQTYSESRTEGMPLQSCSWQNYSPLAPRLHTPDMHRLGR